MATSTLEPLTVTLRRVFASPRAPLLALAVISALSLGARAYKLSEPCSVPCRSADDHTLIFDEAYYVNAARVIAGIHPPSGSHYAQSPLGSDPNAEHPQGAKLIIAGAIELFGDGPFAWRIGSLLFGTLAILAMYYLVRCAGGDRWPAVGAAALMACDNLMLVHGRIGTLDVYALAPMIFGVALYLRGRWLAAAVVLALADCMKEVSPYALIVLAVLEVARVLIALRDPRAPAAWHWRPALGRWFGCALLSIGLFLGGLGLMGLIAHPYADAEGRFITGGPVDELRHIVVYAAQLTGKPSGIASYPWQWLLDIKPIVYLRVAPPLPGQTAGILPVVSFIGEMSPPIMLLAVPSVVFFAVRLVIARPALGAAAARDGVGARDDGGPGSPDGGGFASPERAARTLGDVQMSLLGVAWFVATWVPYELQQALDRRISYTYYMIVVMPGIYVAAIHLVTLGWRRRRRWLRGLIVAWALLVLAAVIVMYPFLAVF
ncbi:MAG TPA: glycosyltransferase family 39 protein [Solirubrobacteraceae bacterium]|nr:glycosyltransferase family 39 protein [Solirubrobacteraceae bacterium]